ALLLGRHDTCRSSLFGLGLLGGHGLIHPVVRGLEIGLAGVGIIALEVGLLAIQEVQVRHGVVVVGTQLNRFLQFLDSILHLGLVLVLDALKQLRAVLLVLEIVGGFQPQFGALLHPALVGLRPVDHRDGVVRLGIVGVELGDLQVILLGLVKLL